MPPTPAEGCSHWIPLLKETAVLNVLDSSTGSSAWTDRILARSHMERVCTLQVHYYYFIQWVVSLNEKPQFWAGICSFAFGTEAAQKSTNSSWGAVSPKTVSLAPTKIFHISSSRSSAGAQFNLNNFNVTNSGKPGMEMPHLAPSGSIPGGQGIIVPSSTFTSSLYSLDL